MELTFDELIILTKLVSRYKGHVEDDMNRAIMSNRPENADYIADKRITLSKFDAVFTKLVGYMEKEQS